MLDVLRHHASSWIIKAILTLIIVTFVISFGTTAFHQAGQSDDVVATVEDEDVTAQMVRGRLKLSQDTNPMLQSLPKEYQGQLQNMVINEMVGEILAKKQALKQGLRVSDAELADFIRNDPNLKNKAGKFDEEFYLNQLRPGYLTSYQMDFEAWMKDRLLVRKLMALYSDPIFIADPLVKLAFEAAHTKLSFKKITLNPDHFVADFKPDPQVIRDEVKKQAAVLATPENSPDEKVLAEQITAQLKLEAGLKEARAFAEKIAPAFKSGQVATSELEKFKSREEDIPPTPATELGRVIPGASPAVVAGLLKLTSENATPDKPIEAGGMITLLKLTAREIPAADAFEKEREAQKRKLTDQLAGEFYDDWFGTVTETAHIEVNRGQ